MFAVEILKTNDSVVKVMSQYKSVVQGDEESGLLFQADAPTGRLTQLIADQLSDTW